MEKKADAVPAIIALRKLAAREKATARDPRLRAKRKRMEARGEKTEEDDWEEEGSESDDLDDFSSDEEEDIGTKNIIGAYDIMAESTRRKKSKVERLESIKKGREDFESRKRAGGSTNTEKLRKKNFVMQSKSWGRVRSTANEKQTRFNGAGKKTGKQQMGKQEKGGKRRRK